MMLRIHSRVIDLPRVQVGAMNLPKKDWTGSCDAYTKVHSKFLLHAA